MAIVNPNTVHTHTQIWFCFVNILRYEFIFLMTFLSYMVSLAAFSNCFHFPNSHFQYMRHMNNIRVYHLCEVNIYILYCLLLSHQTFSYFYNFVLFICEYYSLSSECVVVVGYFFIVFGAFFVVAMLSFLRLKTWRALNFITFLPPNAKKSQRTKYYEYCFCAVNIMSGEVRVYVLEIKHLIPIVREKKFVKITQEFLHRQKKKKWKNSRKHSRNQNNF